MELFNDFINYIFNHLFFMMIIFLLLIFIPLVLIIFIANKKQERLSKKAKVMYVQDINELIHLLYNKDNQSYNILISKLNLLKDVIVDSTFSHDDEMVKIDLEINQLFKGFYNDMKFTMNIDLNQTYTSIEELLRLYNRRKYILKSLHKK